MSWFLLYVSFRYWLITEIKNSDKRSSTIWFHRRKGTAISFVSSVVLSTSYLKMLENSKRWIYWTGLSDKPLIAYKLIIPNSVVQCINLTYLCLALIAYLFYAFEESVFFEYITSATFVTLSFTQITMIYIDLIRNKVKLNYALHYLDEIVQKSEWKRFVLCFEWI